MLIAVRLSAIAKNVPQRNRGGHKFTHEPSVADVSAAEYKEIKNDPYLKICNFPSVGWFDAFGIKRTETNELEHREGGKPDGEYVQIKEAPETARMAPRLSGKAPAKKGSQKDDENEEEKKRDDDRPKELSASSDPADLIKALERRGKKAGKDFEPNAKPEALFALLKSL